MRALIPILLTLLLLPGVALAGEGDPLLSVDDLHTLEASYEAFLEQLGDLIIDRGLLSPEERDAWHDAQMGDFYQNGGYGSILASYMPGLLGFVREEDTLLTLSAQLPCGTLTLSTVRRYTPQDSSLSGLMLTLGLTDEGGGELLDKLHNSNLTFPIAVSIVPLNLMPYHPVFIIQPKIRTLSLVSRQKAIHLILI